MAKAIKAERSSVVTVSDEAALATPDSFSCTVRTSTTFTNKLIGANTISDTSLISMKADGSVEVLTTTSGGESIRTLSEGDSTYSVDEGGRRTLIDRDTEGLGDIPTRAALVSLESLKTACPTWTTDGRYYTFSQSSTSAAATVVYDSALGVLTRMRVESEDELEVQDIAMEYTTVDGYLIPSRVEGTVTYVAGDESYSVHIIQEMEDIEVNTDAADAADAE